MLPAECQVRNKSQGLRNQSVKSSNNDHYRVRPVYGFVEGKGTTKLEIVRLTGPAKEDKLVIQWAEVPPDETDAQAPFKAGAQAGEVILPLKAE
ncbi:MSP domain protein [Necator americanus]|uniref:MSP domain protein n=1 Tax=Necator americanus TaxID=51031 RepID=W2SJA7_NECAM|nr:MSP domain protein [Necator americanus]ETN68812.1 MSP domain protein [Necator americanus]